MAVNAEIDELVAAMVPINVEKKDVKKVVNEIKKPTRNSRVPEVLPSFVLLRAIFTTYVPVPGHPEVKMSREFLAGQVVDDPRDIAFLIENRAIIEYPKDYVIQ